MASKVNGTKRGSTSPEPSLSRSLRPRTTPSKALDMSNGTPSSARKRGAGAAESQPRAKAPPRLGMNALPTGDALRHALPEGKKVEVFCFGTGGSGELGFEVDDEVPLPRRQPWFDTKLRADELGSHGLEDIVLGGMHALARDSNGRVLSFGVNDGAALGRVTRGPGLDNDTLETTPSAVDSALNVPNVLLAAGDSVSVFVDSRGSLQACGSFRTDDGLLGFTGEIGAPQHQFTPVTVAQLVGVPITDVAIGNDHIVAVSTHGHVYVWGNGAQYQLGRKIMERRRTNSLIPERLHLRDIVSVGAGSYHSFAVDSKGQVYSWGPNAVHQTGIAEADGGGDETIEMPRVVAALSPERLNGARVVQMVGGDQHSLFLLDDGRVLACGRTEDGQTGVSPEHPVRMAYKERERELMAQRAELAAIESARRVPNLPLPQNDGTPDGIKLAEAQRKHQADQEAEVFAVAQIAIPQEAIPEPLEVVFGDATSKIVGISAATRHNLAVDDEGVLWSWGSGGQGEMGLGAATTAQQVPKVVPRLGRYHVVKASAGGVHSFVLGYLKEDEPPKPVVDTNGMTS